MAMAMADLCSRIQSDTWLTFHAAIPDSQAIRTQQASLRKKTAVKGKNRGRPGFLGLEFSPAAHVQIKKKYIKVKPATSRFYLDRFHDYSDQDIKECNRFLMDCRTFAIPVSSTQSFRLYIVYLRFQVYSRVTTEFQSCAVCMRCWSK